MSQFIVVVLMTTIIFIFLIIQSCDRETKPVSGDDDLLLKIGESVVEAVLDVEVGCVPGIKYSVE